MVHRSGILILTTKSRCSKAPYPLCSEDFNTPVRLEPRQGTSYSFVIDSHVNSSRYLPCIRQYHFRWIQRQWIWCSPDLRLFDDSYPTLRRQLWSPSLLICSYSRSLPRSQGGWSCSSPCMWIHYPSDVVSGWHLQLPLTREHTKPLGIKATEFSKRYGRMLAQLYMTAASRILAVPFLSTANIVLRSLILIRSRNSILPLIKFLCLSTNFLRPKSISLGPDPPICFTKLSLKLTSKDRRCRGVGRSSFYRDIWDGCRDSAPSQICSPKNMLPFFPSYHGHQSPKVQGSTVSRPGFYLCWSLLSSWM